MMQFLNIAAYKFIELTELPTLRTALKARGNELALRGTILLSAEGINIMLAGLQDSVHAFQRYVSKDPRFSDLYYKQSYSAEITFNRLLVKIKKEIIAFNVPGIDPVNHHAPFVKPNELKQWLDENRDIVLLDTRNDYEVRLGTFKYATDLQLQHFTDFPRAIKKLDPTLKNKTVVTFCTGGIRCEKAALLLQQEGYHDVYQLEGGILDYFAKCGDAHYHGDCFVFDRRVGVNAKLEETGVTQCFACLNPVKSEEQQLPLYVENMSCPHCASQN